MKVGDFEFNHMIYINMCFGKKEIKGILVTHQHNMKGEKPNPRQRITHHVG